jgi:hypothetical protein
MHSGANSRSAHDGLLKTVALWLVTPLTGGVLGIASMVVSTIAGTLDLSDASVDAAKTALGGQQPGQKMTPKQLLALRQAGDDFALKMRQAGFTHAENMAGIQVQADKVATDDRVSARNFAATEHDHTARNLAYMYTVALFGVIGLEFLLAAQQVRVDDSVMRALGTLWHPDRDGAGLEGVFLRVVFACRPAGCRHYPVRRVAGHDSVGAGPRYVAWAAGRCSNAAIARPLSRDAKQLVIDPCELPCVREETGRPEEC